MRPRTPREARAGLLLESLRVGVVGALAVAVWFFAVDLMTGRPLFTPAALGSALFLGAAGPADVVVNGTTVGLYTYLHGVVFILVGLVLTALFRAADEAPSMVAAILLLSVVLEVMFVGAVAIVAQFLLGELAWWTILGGNVVASVAMGGMLLWAHPRTAARLTGSDPLPTA